MATQANRPEVLGPDEDEQEVELSSSALSAIEEADRSHMIRTAKQNPRSLSKFVQELTEIACSSRATAMEMMYSLPRDGKQLVGPSIGFAEACLAVWGNARAGSEVVEVNAREGYVVAEGRYYDCEKNVGRAIRKRRRIVAKKITGDSIQVTGDAACSIATREAILRSIPKPLWKPVWEKAKATAVGDIKSVAQVRDSLVDTFRKVGVTDVQLLNALQVQGLPDIGADEIIAMQAWHKQLAERSVALEDIFGSKEDLEITALMDRLQWNDTKRTMAWEAYKGRRSELLTYLRGLAAENGDGNVTTMPPAAKAEPAKQEAKAEPQPEQSVDDRVAQSSSDLFNQKQQNGNGHAAPKQETKKPQTRGPVRW